MREMRETREIRERERHNSIMKTDRHTDGQSDLLGSLQEPKTGLQNIEKIVIFSSY